MSWRRLFSLLNSFHRAASRAEVERALGAILEGFREFGEGVKTAHD
jgi:hypothetical protein